MDLFHSFWNALQSRSLTGHDRANTNAALLSSVLECGTLLERRFLHEQKADHQSIELSPELSEAVGDQYVRGVTELFIGNLKVPGHIVGDAIAKGLMGLYHANPGDFNLAILE